MAALHAAALALLALSLPPLVSPYSFQFDDNPQQCANVSISITGSGGTPPYRLSIVPWGGTPLSSGLEVRHIIDVPFDDNAKISFTLPYPADSQFVAVVSDHNGTGSNFGSGGVTVPVNVLSGSSNSCLPTTEVHPDFTFSTDPNGVLTTCQSGFLNWDGSASQGQVKFWGIILGGDAFVISGPQTTDGSKPAISWAPQIASGVNVLVVAGDNRGFGSGGSFQGSLQPGNGTTSCLTGNSPHSTPGSPAGGSYPTNNSGGRTSGGSGSSSNHTGAIVGGVVGGVGGVALIGLIVFFLLRRRRSQKRFQERPVDLLDGRTEQDAGEGGAPRIPEQYIPEPYHVPESTAHEMSEASTSGGPMMLSSRDRRVSGLSATSQTRPSSEGSSSTPWRSTTTGKTAAGPTSLRPVNIIQHEDAGQAGPPKPEEEEEPETVELPPAYTNLRA